MHSRLACQILFILALGPGLAGCAGSGEGLDQNGQPITAGGGGGQTLTPDLDSIQANVFTPLCASCHTGATAPVGLRLDGTHSYSQLVNVPSSEDSSVLRVKPGDPDASYLVQKIDGHASVGAQMPLGGPYVASDVTAVISQWITDGAPPATTAAVADEPRDVTE